MGNRDKGGRETKKPKKSVKETRVLTSTEAPLPASVEVVPRKRKAREDEE